MIQKINQPNLIGLECDLAPSLAQAFASLAEAWHTDEILANMPFDHLRINPLQAEQHPPAIQGVTVVQSADVAVGRVQLVAGVPF